MAKRKTTKAKTTGPSKKAKSTHEDTAPPRASFLGIPGESRNSIYRLALVNAHRVVVDRKHCEEPGVLRICRQIRTEARPIHRKENKFCLVVCDFVAPVKPFWIWNSDVPHQKIYIQLKGRQVYPNLKNLLRLYYQGCAKRTAEVSDDDGPALVVVNCFCRIVETL